MMFAGLMALAGAAVVAHARSARRRGGGGGGSRAFVQPTNVGLYTIACNSNRALRYFSAILGMYKFAPPPPTLRSMLGEVGLGILVSPQCTATS